jgi:glutamine synthetase
MTETALADLAAAAAARGADRPTGEYVLVGMPDVNGQLRGKAMRRTAFEAALRDDAVLTDLLLAIDPVDEPITDYEQFGIRAGSGDVVLRVEEASLRELAWLPGWRVCLATPLDQNGNPSELGSREVCRRALAGLAELGYDARAAFEYEIRLRDADGHPLSSGLSYSFIELGRFNAFLAKLEPALATLGVELAGIHTEAGPGLLELNLAAGDGGAAADDATLVKFAVKAIAASMGLVASFLAKTTPGEEGSSGHAHLSLWQDGASAFGEGDAHGDLPAPFSATIAGVLDHLPAASLLLNPTINSYKRLVPGWFAPVNVSWGHENRTAAVRAIRTGPVGRWRIECRRPGADANPYLALAALVAAAADGIRREADPPPPVEGDACERDDLPPLPGSLESALAAFAADPEFRAALGEPFCDYYATSRAWELKAWRQGVSDWERERYERAV